MSRTIPSGATMYKERFAATVQYNDLTGSAAADRADKAGPEEWLRAQNHIASDDFVVGIELWAGENHGAHRDPITAHFLVVKGDYDSTKNGIAQTSGAYQTRRVTVEMPVAQFMGLFKRFSVTLSPSGMLHNKSFSYDD
jgi:hypothetical protein